MVKNHDEVLGDWQCIRIYDTKTETVLAKAETMPKLMQRLLDRIYEHNNEGFNDLESKTDEKFVNKITFARAARSFENEEFEIQTGRLEKEMVFED